MAGVDNDLDELQFVEFGVGLELGALGIEAYAAVGLLVGGDSQVGDGLGWHESDVRSLALRVKSSVARCSC